MVLHTHSLFSIYFGDAQDAIYPEEFRSFAKETPILEHPACAQLKKLLPSSLQGIATESNSATPGWRPSSLTFLHQIHSNQGMVITNEHTQPAFTYDGDYLITNKKIALGVLTADCLPIVMYDKVHHALAVIHAGWRGSVQEIAVKTLTHMATVFGTKPEHLSVLFGPCAKFCCYTVTEEFKDHITAFSWADRTMQKIGADYHFALPLFNALQLEKVGVNPENISVSYNVCTMCNTNFFSHRRQGINAGRQMTVAWLK